jgi:serine/threonine-protein kinase RsbW
MLSCVEGTGVDRLNTLALRWTSKSLSSPAEVVPLVERVVAAMEEMGHSDRACWEFRLVLVEAIVNGLRHGNQGDPDKQVVVRWCLLREGVVVEVEDEGPGFDPTLVPDPTALENLDRPCGRGLFLMKRYTSWLYYHGRGNRLTLCKLGPSQRPSSL